jgi:DNA excision repair protein ERCC-2
MIMDHLDDWFPYPSFRPNQREMLEVVARHARSGGVVMIDAPTGSGKTSTVAALISERSEKKVIVAVRTISQLNTFIRELSLIRKKKPSLKFSFLVGKSNLCPLSGTGDTYRKCEGVKALSTTLMRERAEQGSLVPSSDPVVRKQIARLDHEHPMICPFYINSRIFSRSDTGVLKMAPSPQMRTKSEKVFHPGIFPHQVTEMSGDVCPYETMLHAAQKADVIVLNYYHLLDDMIREQLYASLNIEPAGVLLLIDEAHNCGEVFQEVHSVRLEESVLEQASSELIHLKRTVKGVDAVRHLIPGITGFIEGLKNSLESEDWFDPKIFERIILKGSLYQSISDIVEELMFISERIRENNMKSGEFRETGIERLTAFMFRLEQSASDPSYLTVYRKEEEVVRLEVRNIDPGAKMREFVTSHHCCILISGTL